MLSDIFGSLEIDDADSVEAYAKFCTPSEYSAGIHNVGWFLRQQSFKGVSEENREIINHRATYFHHHNEYNKAFKEYKVLLCQWKHSRTHSVAVLDSLIRCALMISSHVADELLEYLQQYEECALDYGDQLQYITLAKDIYAYITGDSAPRKFVDTVCLLCAFVDLPEHWLAFGERKLLTVGKNFHIGYITRAIVLLELQIKTAHGFIIRVMEKKLRICNERLTEMKYPQELIREARMRMSGDFVSYEESMASSNHFYRSMHDCKPRTSFYRTDEDLDILLKGFKQKFSWMFEGCSF